MMMMMMMMMMMTLMQMMLLATTPYGDLPRLHVLVLILTIHGLICMLSPSSFQLQP